MTVKELKDILAGYPDDMRVIATLHSDYCDLDEPRVLEVLPRPRIGSYLRYYPRQHPTPPESLAKVLYFEGNLEVADDPT